MNSLKSFVKNIADKAGGADFSPVRSLSRDDGGVGVNAADTEAEGFICPTCMRGFSSPDELQVHYETSHSSEASLLQAKKNEGHFSDLRDEVSRVQSSLKEEQFYSTELKREVERLSSAVVEAGQKRMAANSAANHGEVGDEEEERRMYREQVRALQEGKALLSQEVIALRQGLADSQLTAKEKEKLIEKAAHLAAENVALKSALDEVSEHKAAIEDRLKLVALDLKQRNENSTDDTAVLKQELISVQKMMDDSSQQKEKELSVLQRQYDALQNSLSSGQSELAERIGSLTAEKMELQRLGENRAQEISALQSALEDKERANISLERMLTEVQHEASDKGQELTFLKEQVLQLKSEKHQLDASITSEKKQLQTEMDKLQHRLEAEQDKVGELSNLQHLHDEQCQANDDLKGQVQEFKGSLAEAQRHLNSKELELSNSMEMVKSLQNESMRMKEEKAQLLLKIEDGDGANTALTQLTQQNEILLSQLEDSVQASKQSATDLEGKIDTLHSQLHESRTSVERANEKTTKLDQLLAQKQSKLDNAERANAKLSTELQAKSELLAVSEKASASQLQDLEELLKKSHSDLEKKSSEAANHLGKLGEVQDQLRTAQNNCKNAEAENVAKLSELKSKESSVLKLQEKCREMENKEQTANEKLVTTQEAETNLRKAYEALEQECRSIQVKLQQSEQLAVSVQQELVVVKTQASNYNKELSEALSNLQEKEAEVRDLKATSDSLRRDEDDMKARLREGAAKEAELLSTIDDQLAMTSSIKKEAQGKVEMQEKDISSLKSKLKSCEEELAKAEEKVNQMQFSREKENKEMEEEIADLKQAKEMLLSSKVDQQNKLDETQRDLLKSESVLEELKCQMSKKEKELRDEIIRIQNVTKEQSTSHHSAIKKHEEESTSLKNDISSIQQSCTSKLEEIALLQSKMKDLDKQLDSSLSDKLELEAKIGSANDERKTLLERCLEAEGELERSRATVIELRRKLDDSQAALHELGRENQSIQVELAKQTDRKWVDDDEVKHCQTCSSQFTLRNRKHHCRNCLQIFCADCSSKQVQMANYKKPQRVCDQCYSEIQLHEGGK